MASSIHMASKIVNSPVSLFAGIRAEQLGSVRSWSGPNQHALAIHSPNLRVCPAALSSAPLGSPCPSLFRPVNCEHTIHSQASNAPAFTSPNKIPDLLLNPAGNLEKGVLNKNLENEKEKMQQWIDEIRGMFQSMDDGQISVSPYDTAWVALVPALDGLGGPQFPKALEWIIDNQFADGSWGDFSYFTYCDRVCNTLACVLALQTWSPNVAAIKRGVTVIQQNLQMIATEEEAHMTIGFEIVFPALIKEAQKLGLDLPYESPFIVSIASERKKKIQRIPMDLLHHVPTTLLHSLEGFHQEVDWEKLMQLQSEDGSFLNSPAATAACLLHVKDEKALGYLNGLLARFDNAVPNVYPVDLFEHMWMVDRTERLGISRHFEKEIKDSLDYVYKYFTSIGIGWARNSSVQDLDDTAMGFRLLRLHGYDVNENVFQQFRSENGEFVCFAGQSGQAVTGLFNFYRAAQTRFPGESILEAAEPFARNFLSDSLANNACFDKWIITKDLAGEVEHALDTPWYCSMPGNESLVYLNHYGPDDIWIGKSLYRMPFINNETFLALAKAEYNLCQSVRPQELQKILRWSDDCEFGKLPYARQMCYDGVYTTNAIFPNPEYGTLRLVWGQNGVVVTILDDYFDVAGVLPDMRKFVTATREWDPSLMEGTAEKAQITFNGMFNFVNMMTRDLMVPQGRDIGPHLRDIWLRQVEAMMTEAEWKASGFWPSLDEYLEVACTTIGLEPILCCSIFSMGELIGEELPKDPKVLLLRDLMNRSGRLLNDIQGYKRESSQGKVNAVTILLRENPSWTEEDAIAEIRVAVGETMRVLVRETLEPSHIPKRIRDCYFLLTRTMNLYYAHTDLYSSDSEAVRVFKDQMKSFIFDPVM